PRPGSATTRRRASGTWWQRRCSRTIRRARSSSSACSTAGRATPRAAETTGPRSSSSARRAGAPASPRPAEPDATGTFISSDVGPIRRGSRIRRVPMLQPARTFTAALVAAALLLGSAGTAGAVVFEDQGLDAVQKDTPVLLDAFVLRPLGLALTAIGTVLFVPAAAVVGATRPVDL